MLSSLRNEYFVLSAAVSQERGGALRVLEAWRSAKQGTMNELSIASGLFIIASPFPTHGRSFINIVETIHRKRNSTMSVFTASERIPGINITLGESMNIPTAMLTRQHRAKHVRSFSEATKLPPAVAAVPADHIRGYVHSKRVNSYLVGSTLGEGSFAKVKEGFHVLVGEKVWNTAISMFTIMLSLIAVRR